MPYQKKKLTCISVEVKTNDEKVDVSEIEQSIAESVREVVDVALQDFPSNSDIKQIRISVVAEDN